MNTWLPLLLAALLTGWIVAPVSAQPLQKIRIGYPSISSRQAQLWVAKDEGLLKNMASMSS